MSISALQLDQLAPPPALAARHSATPGSFNRLLRDAARADDAKQADDAARKLVSLAFIEPVLAQLRETSQAAGPFSPGDAERRFGPLFDQHVADRITSSANFPLVDSLRQHLLGKAESTGGAQEDAHG